MVAVILRRQQVRVTFLGSAARTVRGDSLDTHWAPWWKARGGEGHAFASRTRDEVHWLGDERGVPPQFRVRPATGAFAGRTFTWSAAKYCDNIQQAADRLSYVTGVPTLSLFRAPGGRTSPRLLEAARACGWQHITATPIDFPGGAAPSAKGATRGQVAQTVTSVQPGNVLLTHLGIWSREVPQMPVGLDELIAGLKERGFCFRTLNEHPDYQDWISEHR